MARYLIVSVVAASLIALAQTPAAAQSGADKAAAEKLFNDARKLMKKGNYSEACPKLDASLKLDPALGTRLNLAKCYEEVGKLASAWGLYREAEDLAKQNKDNRARFARSRAKALEPRLPQLVIKAPSEDEIPGLTVTRDGTTIDRGLLALDHRHRGRARGDHGRDPAARASPQGRPGYSNRAHRVAGHGRSARRE